MDTKKDIKKLLENEADNYFIYKFDELANEKEKMGFTNFARMCRENIERIKANKDLIEFDEVSKINKGEIKKHVGISRRYSVWLDELADEKEKKGNIEYANIFRKRAARVRECSRFFWVWDKKYNELEDKWNIYKK